MRRVLSGLVAAVLCASVGVHAENNAGLGGHERELENIITVSSSGGHFETLGEALDYLSTVAPPPAEDNRFVIRIGPGVYEGHVEMMDWVNIEGSGQEVTVITKEGADSFFDSYTVLGADNAVLSRMTVESTGGGAQYTIGILCDQSSPTLRDLHVVSFGANGSVRGIYLVGSDATLENVVVEASGGTVAIALGSNYGAPSLKGVELRAFSATAENDAMAVGFSNGVVRIVDSLFQAGTGGESRATGLKVDRSAGVFLNEVEVVASAASVSLALTIFETPDVMVKDCILTATGGAASDAVHDWGSNSGLLERRFINSSLRGDRTSIYIENTNRHFVGGSQLSGSVTRYLGGTTQCVASFNEMFEALDENCDSASPPVPTPTPTPPPPTLTPTPTPTPPSPTPTPVPTPT